MFAQSKLVFDVAVVVVLLVQLVCCASPSATPNREISSVLASPTLESRLPTAAPTSPPPSPTSASESPALTPTLSPRLITPAPVPDAYPASSSAWRSPDGQWVAALQSSQRDEVPVSAFCSGSASERPTSGDLHIVFQIVSRTGTVRTIWDEWICGLGYMLPKFLTWSQDSQHLFFTTETVAGGDPPVFKNDVANILCFDLADGQVTEVPVPDGYAHTISPDESRIVYTSRSDPPELVIYDIATETEQRVAFWDQFFSEPRDDTEAGSVLWTPDGGSLYFMAVNGHMGDAEYTVARLDLSSLIITLLIKDERRLIWPREWVDGRLLVADWNRVSWWIDAQTGEMTTSPVVP